MNYQDCGGLGTVNKIGGFLRKVFAWVPVMGGVDPSGNVRALACDTSGNLTTAATTTGATVTPTTSAIGASASGNIPAGAKGFTFTAISGTVTLGGQTMPVGLTISSTNVLASNLAYTTGGGSSAYLYYES